MTRNPVSVALVIANHRLRDLVRTDLEQAGFTVVSAISAPDPAGSAEADVVVTESAETRGKLLTVRLTEALATPESDPSLVLAHDDLGILAELLDTNLPERSVTA